MKNESTLRRLVRNIVFADYRKNDKVPFIGSSVGGSAFAPAETVQGIEAMSKIGKFFLYLWFAFVIFMMLWLLFAGVAVVMDPQAVQKLGFFLGIAFVLLELFILIQGLSILGYCRWRIKQRLHRR